MSYEFIKGETQSTVRPEYLQLVVVAAFWQDKILLVHRQSAPFEGRYSIPGGHVEDGEDYESAAGRELTEETGIKATALMPLQIFIDHDNRLECHGFRFDSPDGTFSNPDNEEQEVLGWKELDEAMALPLTPGLKDLFATF